MAQRMPNKPLMVEDVQSVLIPAMEKVFVNKKEFEKFKNDFNRFEEKSFDFFISKQDLADLETRIKEEMGEKFDKVLTLSDKILKNLLRWFNSPELNHKVLQKHMVQVRRPEPTRINPFSYALCRN